MYTALRRSFFITLVLFIFAFGIRWIIEYFIFPVLFQHTLAVSITPPLEELIQPTFSTFVVVFVICGILEYRKKSKTL